MFKIIAIVVVVLIAAVLIYAATQPDTFRVERSASIKAPIAAPAQGRLSRQGSRLSSLAVPFR